MEIFGKDQKRRFQNNKFGTFNFILFYNSKEIKYLDLFLMNNSKRILNNAVFLKNLL